MLSLEERESEKSEACDFDTATKQKGTLLQAELD